MPHLISVGSYIIKLDTNSISNSFDNAVKTVKDAPIIKDSTSNIKNEVEATVNSAQEAVKEELIQAV